MFKLELIIVFFFLSSSGLLTITKNYKKDYFLIAENLITSRKNTKLFDSNNSIYYI